MSNQDPDNPNNGLHHIMDGVQDIGTEMIRAAFSKLLHDTLVAFQEMAVSTQEYIKLLIAEHGGWDGIPEEQKAKLEVIATAGHIGNQKAQELAHLMKVMEDVAEGKTISDKVKQELQQLSGEPKGEA